MYEIKISSGPGLLEATKDGVRVLRPGEDASLLELDSFLGVLQGSLSSEEDSNVFLKSLKLLLEHLKANSSQKTVEITVTTTKEADCLVHKFHFSAE